MQQRYLRNRDLKQMNALEKIFVYRVLHPIYSGIAEILFYAVEGKIPRKLKSKYKEFKINHYDSKKKYFRELKN